MNSASSTVALASAKPSSPSRSKAGLGGRAWEFKVIGQIWRRDGFSMGC